MFRIVLFGHDSVMRHDYVKLFLTSSRHSTRALEPV